MKPLSNIEIWVGASEIGFLFAVVVSTIPESWIIAILGGSWLAMPCGLLWNRWRAADRPGYLPILIDQLLFWMSILAGWLFFLGPSGQDALWELFLAILAGAFWVTVGWGVHLTLRSRGRPTSREPKMSGVPSSSGEPDR